MRMKKKVSFARIKSQDAIEDDATEEGTGYLASNAPPEES